MKIKKFKPTSPGVRHRVVKQKNLLGKNNSLIKNLIQPLKQSFGRSTNTGRITAWHRGGGVKRKYRDFLGKNSFAGFIVVGVFYDPNRSAYISLNFDIITKTFEFSIAPFYVLPGSCFLINDTLGDLNLGARTSLRSLPPGSIIHNIGLATKRLGVYGRSAGTSCQIIQKDSKYASIKLPSGKIIKLPLSYYASLGFVSNFENRLTVPGKAGSVRLKGRRPIVRGIAMNPVDHPHGGRTNGGRPCVTPWGIPTKGKPTVKRK